jgi:hypothetical protein
LIMTLATDLVGLMWTRAPGGLRVTGRCPAGYQVETVFSRGENSKVSHVYR